MALYAVEENRSYGTKNGVCLESDADAEFSSAVPGVWDQRKDRIQVEGALFALSAWWVALGIDLERGRPGHPQDNGAHERMHRDISREIEALGQSDQEAMDIWRHSFNYERPHEALLMRCPGELYRFSERLGREGHRPSCQRPSA